MIFFKLKKLKLNLPLPFMANNSIINGMYASVASNLKLHTSSLKAALLPSVLHTLCLQPMS